MFSKETSKRQLYRLSILSRLSVTGASKLRDFETKNPFFDITSFVSGIYSFTVYIEIPWIFSKPSKLQSRFFLIAWTPLTQKINLMYLFFLNFVPATNLNNSTVQSRLHCCNHMFVHLQYIHQTKQNIGFSQQNIRTFQQIQGTKANAYKY